MRTSHFGNTTTWTLGIVTCRQGIWKRGASLSDITSSSIHNTSPATFFHYHHCCENSPLSLVTIASYRGSLTYSWAQFQCWSDHHGLAEDGASGCGRGSLHVGITQWSWSIGECQQPAVTQRNSSIRGECQQQLEIDRYPPYFFFLD